MPRVKRFKPHPWMRLNDLLRSSTPPGTPVVQRLSRQATTIVRNNPLFRQNARFFPPGSFRQKMAWAAKVSAALAAATGVAVEYVWPIVQRIGGRSQGMLEAIAAARVTGAVLGTTAPAPNVKTIKLSRASLFGEPSKKPPKKKSKKKKPKKNRKRKRK